MAGVEQKQGHLGNLDEKSLPQLHELLTRQENLLKNKKFVNGLPDKGEKIRSFVQDLQSHIAAREKVDNAVDLFENMTLDEEMKEPDETHLEEKDVNIMVRVTEAAPRKPFCPHRDLRSNLEDSLEEVSTKHVHNPQDMPQRGKLTQEDISRVQNLIIKADQLTREEFDHYSAKCENLTIQPAFHCTLDPSQQYTFVIIALLTNHNGENSDICRFVAKTNTKTFSEYALPAYVSSGVTKTYGLKIDHHRGVRVLTRHGVDTNAKPLQIVLKDFMKFIGEIENRVVLISVRQVNTLLYNLKVNHIAAPDVVYGNCSRSYVREVTSDAVVDELRLVDILSDGLERSTSQVMEATQLFDLRNAELHLDQSVEYTKRLNSLRGKLFDFSLKEKEVISKEFAKEIAEIGLDYNDLDRLYLESELALVSVLVRSESEKRITRSAEEIAAILKYFNHKHNLYKFDETLEGDPMVKLVPLDESIKLMRDQKKRMEEIQIAQAKQRLVKHSHVNLEKFDPEVSKSSLSYRERTEGDSDEDEGVKDEEDEDSEEEKDYPA